MQEKDIKNILTDTYDFEKWHRVIDFVFPNVNFENSIVQLDDTSNKTKYIHQKGDIQLTDGKKIIILEVGIKKENKIAKTKVGFHNLTAKFIDQANNHGILVFYVSEDKTQVDYRLSLICKESRFNEDGTFEEFKTNPKRYTYLLGQNETGTTAAKRLKELAAKKNGFDFELKDVVDAFSVEKLNDEFFRKYKEQFQIFNNYLIEDAKVRYDIFEIDRNEKDTDKVVNELPIRDFTKKLLGRLVFLYFLQRKGWMGVITPASGKDVVWKSGYADFIHKLFREAKHQSKFHSKYLTELFYNTLNNENRVNFVFLIDKKSPFADGVNRSVPYLNGGLFDDDFPKGNAIDFPEKLFENLFEFLEQYNFTIDENSPEDHEVGIDPEMLGHIFENLLEDNRDKGAYYTPKEVVHYMSQQSIIEYLNHNLNYYSSDVEEFIKANVVSDYIIKEHSKIEKLLKEVKVCDPAIGSGAFPMGVLKVIYTALHNLHNAINPTKKFNEAKTKKDIIQKSIYGVDLERGAVDIARLRFWLALVVDEDVPQPLPNLDYKIMQGNSILEKFEDVDLSSLLKEDTDNEIITAHNGQVELVGFGRNQSVFVFDSTTKEEFQSLLDLYFDFKVDKSHKYKSKKEVKKKINAIIEGKLKAKFALDKIKYQDKLAEKQSHLKANTIYAYDPKGIQDKKQKAIEKLNKEIEFLEYKIAHLVDILNRLNRWEHQEKERPYFLWHTYFKDVFDNGKFDIIIGNPPYIKEYTNKSAFDGIRDSAYYMGKMDIWYFFACFCIDMLKDNGGIQCFIAQSNWITSSGAAKLRNKIVQETEMLSFIDFGNYKVFQSAGIQTMIYVVKKTATPPTHYTTKYARLLVDNIDKTFLDYFLQSENVAQHENFEKLQFEFVPANYVDGYITFANDINDNILKKIQSVEYIKLTEKEVAQGIVPNPDVVNTRNFKRFSKEDVLNNKIEVGDGVFVVKKGTFDALDEIEKKYVKPIFEPNEVHRYKFIDNYETEIIYITKKNYKNDAPSLIEHLAKFKPIMEERRENQKGTLDFFHLHWPRDEFYFEEGEKILSVRKCDRPTFIYSKQSAYVMMAFNIIKTERVNLKFLTALLNSKLIAFWLKNKGKMQGNNYQIDKEPLLEIPIVTTDKQQIFATLVDYILLVHQPRKEQLIKYIGNDLIIHSFEEVIDQAFYELYFGNEPEMQELKVLQHLQDIKPISEEFTDEDIETVVKFYHSIQEQKAPFVVCC
ncbi:MAG: Eco57I restriction-modification methylase domain-containing protein [Bacteroidetes bacterium]|nr:Eco57I restriction-modification methylase domain-containing protein [Bacteroidota bacterium]